MLRSLDCPLSFSFLSLPTNRATYNNNNNNNHDQDYQPDNRDSSVQAHLAWSTLARR